MLKRIKNKKIPWRHLLSLILILRGLTLVVAYFAQKFLPFKFSFPYAEIVLFPYGSPLLWSFGNFDGVHYLLLSEKGYVFGLTQAFFPFYPLLIRWLALIIHNRILVGLLISHFSLVGALILLFKLVKLDFSSTVAKKTILSLIFFPTAFFFLSIYTESLFLFLLLGSFYLIRQKKFWLAGVVGAIASATRLVGIFLVIAFLYEWWLTSKRRISQLVASLLPTGGLLIYMNYLGIKFGDPLMFAHVQAEFGAGRSSERLILLYQVFWRYLKMIFTVDRSNPIYFTVWLEFLSAFIFLLLLAWAWHKGERKSYLLFAILAYLLPTLTGTFSSMPRYVLVLFPAFIMLGRIKSAFWYSLWLLISASLLIISTALFTRGYWIS